MTIPCQEFCIYYPVNISKQPCKIVLMVPILQVEKYQQEVIK